jgi:hypothetical protein
VQAGIGSLCIKFLKGDMGGGLRVKVELSILVKYNSALPGVKGEFVFSVSANVEGSGGAVFAS